MKSILNSVMSYVHAHPVILETTCCCSLLLSSCGVKRPFHLPPAALTLLPFPVQCHDRTAEEGFFIVNWTITVGRSQQWFLPFLQDVWFVVQKAAPQHFPIFSPVHRKDSDKRRTKCCTVTSLISSYTGAWVFLTHQLLLCNTQQKRKAAAAVKTIT